MAPKSLRVNNVFRFTAISFDFKAKICVENIEVRGSFTTMILSVELGHLLVAAKQLRSVFGTLFKRGSVADSLGGFGNGLVFGGLVFRGKYLVVVHGSRLNIQIKLIKNFAYST